MSNSLIGKSFGVLYVDPPWLFSLHSEKGEEKSPQAKYDCMPTDQIIRLKEELGLEWCMAPNSVCIMWATFPMLPDALRVMEAWGFKYKTGGTWLKLTAHGKNAFGTGYIYRSAAEPWILGTRGEPRSRVKDQRNVIVPDMAIDPANVINPDAVEYPFLAGSMLADYAREHSRKPDAMIEIIERQFKGPYLEVFARQKREGWDSWGNQVDHFPV